jgi:hypothetical protein
MNSPAGNVASNAGPTVSYSIAARTAEHFAERVGER